VALQDVVKPSEVERAQAAGVLHSQPAGDRQVVHAAKHTATAGGLSDRHAGGIKLAERSL